MATDTFIEITCNIKKLTDAIQQVGHQVKRMNVNLQKGLNKRYTGYFHLTAIKLFQAIKMVERLKRKYATNNN